MNFVFIIGCVLLLSWFIVFTYGSFAKELESRGTIIIIAWVCFVIGALCIFFNT